MKQVLVDTSIWIEFFKHEDGKESEVLKDLLAKDLVVLAGPILTELFQGVKTKKEIEILKEIFAALPMLKTEDNLWERAGLLSHEIRKHGHTLKTMDAIIAQYALDNSCLLYSIDKDFKLIAQYSSLELLPI